MLMRVLLVTILILNLTGCAPSSKLRTQDMRFEQLEAKIDGLARDIDEKDREIRDLEAELERIKKGNLNSAKKIKTAKKSEESTPKKIQTALTNAGFYKGPIDGKIGQQTEKAVKEFQRANGLKADGVIGKKTWVKLQQYL